MELFIVLTFSETFVVELLFPNGGRGGVILVFIIENIIYYLIIAKVLPGKLSHKYFYIYNFRGYLVQGRMKRHSRHLRMASYRKWADNMVSSSPVHSKCDP